MIAILFCLAAFGLCYYCGRRSLPDGIVALLAVGYFYGILRANLLVVYSHFIFDGALLGLYFANRKHLFQSRNTSLRLWTIVLIAWPMIVSVLPFQPLMVSIVGLRGNIFFLPILLLATRLQERDLIKIANGMSVLNLVALGFAAGEYFTSVENFYPWSAVTLIIYISNDVVGGFYRIPAIFVNAHSYGGAMVATLPFLTGAWIHGQDRRLQILCGAGLGAAFLGILLSATRLNFIMGCVALAVILLTSRMKTGARIGFAVLMAALAITALTNSRFQRYKSLDTGSVSDRIAGSVNRGFGEILVEHPMGNGLGGGGTSLPYFLQGSVRNPIGLESEYSRILCEQGVIGFLLWVGFIGWILACGQLVFVKSSWQGARRLAYLLCLATFGTGLIGVGMLTAIPATAIFLLNLGWVITPARRVARVSSELRSSPKPEWSERYGHAY